MPRPSAYCCIYHNTSNGDKIVMKMYFILMLRIILNIFSQEIYGDNGRIYQFKIYKKMLTPLTVVTVPLINSVVATPYLPQL